jgi:hypothetical protein
VRSVNLFMTKEKKMKKKLFALSGVFMIVLVFAGLWATKAINLTQVQQTEPATHLATKLTLEEMARGATFIGIGQCTGTQSKWVGRRLFSLATVSISETFKGAPVETLTVALPGGNASTGNGKFQISMHYPDAPTMYQGEEMALFLVKGEDEVANAYAVMGNNQGKFSIVADNTGAQVLMRDMVRARVQTVGAVRPGNVDAMTLQEFRARVMNALR